MTNPNQQSEAHEGPDGSLFLPENERELANYQTALLLGRGVAAALTLEERELHYHAAGEALQQLKSKCEKAIGRVAIAP